MVSLFAALPFRTAAHRFPYHPTMPFTPFILCNSEQVARLGARAAPSPGAVALGLSEGGADVGNGGSGGDDDDEAPTGTCAQRGRLVALDDDVMRPVLMRVVARLPAEHPMRLEVEGEVGAVVGSTGWRDALADCERMAAELGHPLPPPSGAAAAADDGGGGGGGGGGGRSSAGGVRVSALQIPGCVWDDEEDGVVRGQADDNDGGLTGGGLMPGDVGGTTGRPPLRRGLSSLFSPAGDSPFLGGDDGGTCEPLETPGGAAVAAATLLAAAPSTVVPLGVGGAGGLDASFSSKVSSLMALPSPAASLLMVPPDVTRTDSLVRLGPDGITNAAAMASMAAMVQRQAAPAAGEQQQQQQQQEAKGGVLQPVSAGAGSWLQGGEDDAAGAGDNRHALRGSMSPGAGFQMDFSSGLGVGGAQVGGGGGGTYGDDGGSDAGALPEFTREGSEAFDLGWLTGPDEGGGGGGMDGGWEQGAAAAAVGGGSAGGGGGVKRTPSLLGRLPGALPTKQPRVA